LSTSLFLVSLLNYNPVFRQTNHLSPSFFFMHPITKPNQITLSIEEVVESS